MIDFVGHVIIGMVCLNISWACGEVMFNKVTPRWVRHDG